MNNIQRYNIDQAAEKWQTDKGRWCKWEDVNDLLIKHVDLIKRGDTNQTQAIVAAIDKIAETIHDKMLDSAIAGATGTGLYTESAAARTYADIAVEILEEAAGALAQPEENRIE